MEKKEVEICVYGAEQICASFVNLPSSKDTYEWLEALSAESFPISLFRSRMWIFPFLRKMKKNENSLKE